MAKIAKYLTELIGNTPLLEISNYEKKHGLNAKLIGKVEYFNPLGSVKDRVAAAMIEQAEKDGKVNKDTVIIEPTSGNTGIGLAFVTAAKGLHLILTMPDTMSVERRKIVAALGAEIVLTPGREGMQVLLIRPQSLKKNMAMHLFHSSLRMKLILQYMKKQQLTKSGMIQMERLIYLYQL